jgi:hypothetical protein
VQTAAGENWLARCSIRGKQRTSRSWHQVGGPRRNPSSWGHGHRHGSPASSQTSPQSAPWPRWGQVGAWVIMATHNRNESAR